jgi:hypothetical protein
MMSFARNVLGLESKIDINMTALGGRGSDRSFYRLTWNATESAMLIRYEPKRVENAYYGDIALFLDQINIPVPKLIHHDVEQCLMLMEDLGDNDLWSHRNGPWEFRRDLYQKTLSIVHKLHSFPLEELSSTKVRLTDPFDFQLYEWERNYFKKNFVEKVCRVELEPASVQKLDEELDNLVNHIYTGIQSLIHRDLQSQNIMIRHGEPYLIDFQGMRIGSPFYDLGSLLCDPYVQISREECEQLLSFYYRLSKRNLAWPDFQQLFWEASVQRLMQALGAYGFLGITKGITAFLDHIPAGLAKLQAAAEITHTLPFLLELARQCHKAINTQ